MFHAADWTPPPEWSRLETIESHAGGEPLRVIVDGIPELEGDTILQKRSEMRNQYDHLRRAVMLEPRGHADMYGAIPVEPERTDSDMGVLFTHNSGYSTMCGHGIIALTTVAGEIDGLALNEAQPVVSIDTPAGQVHASATIDGDRVSSVTFENVPSFVYVRDRTVTVPNIGQISYDIAFGGAFYAYCETDEVGVELEKDNVENLIEIGRSIKKAVNATIDIDHPTDDELGYLYGTIIAGPAQRDDCDVRNVCVFADGEVDRSPTGTGVSGWLALEHDRGTLAVGDHFTIESIVGSTFTGTIGRRTTVGDYDAVVPNISGQAHITGRSEFVIDPADQLRDGFILR